VTVYPKLHLHLKGEYFDQIKAGAKLEEFRLRTPYWIKRIRSRTYSGIVIHRGYPAKDTFEFTILRPWRGFTEKTITHPHFGLAPVEVFAIIVNEESK